MKSSIVVFLAFLIICNMEAKTIITPADSLFEILPLHPHLHYTYDYLSSISIQEVAVITGSSLDSGSVEYFVHDSTIVNDSTVLWNVEVRRSILHTVTIQYGAWDTTHWISDTTLYILTETTNGLHALSIAGPIWQYPLVTPIDTTQVPRYFRVSTDTIVKQWFTGNLWGHDSLMFVNNLGLVLRMTSTVSGLSHITRTSVSTTILLHASPVLIVSSTFDRPMSFQLSQNYPNPFNPSTKIVYFLQNSSYIALRLYDLLGREVKVLDEGTKTAGRHTVVLHSAELPSGTYFYQLTVGNWNQTKKLVIMK